MSLIAGVNIEINKATNFSDWAMIFGTYPRFLNYSLPKVSHWVLKRRFFATKSDLEPLRILFCGSDYFSIASLRKLYEEHQQDKELIASIDVVCRPAKAVGRGRKTVREVPIAEVANKLRLPLHQFDTFRGWQPPKSEGLAINLIVAVSFGLFVPRRILEGARYGGLNVHPSILPDFHGPAPLHHTLLSDCKHAGVTVQTLHPKHFDRGRILAQTDPPGWEHRCGTVPELLEQVAPAGADMLLSCIKNRLYLFDNDIPEQVRDAQEAAAAAARAAPKITPNDRFINWETWTAEEVMRRHRVIGPLWSSARLNDEGKSEKRIIWSAGFNHTSNTPTVDVPIGQPVVIGTESSAQNVYVRTCDNKMLAIREIKIEGGEQAKPIQAAKKAGMADNSTLRDNAPLFAAQISTALLNPAC